MKRMLARGCLLVLALVTVLAFTASAQSINQHAIQKQLEHKVLLLRGRYLCPSHWTCKLTFNQQGQLQSKAVVGPFSLSAIYVDKVKFRGSALVILAHGVTLARLGKSSRSHRFTGLVLNHRQLKIQIPFTPSQPLALQNSLSAIFSDSIKQTLNAEPPGQREADIASLPLLTPESKAEPLAGPGLLGRPNRHVYERLHKNAVMAPKAYYQPEPRFTEKAKSDGVQGKCDLALIVNAQGFPQNIRILKPLPDGLDERAIAALSQYRFRPAMLNGKPVPVHLVVEVDFHLY